jgi:hypothetical protein
MYVTFAPLAKDLLTLRRKLDLLLLPDMKMEGEIHAICISEFPSSLGPSILIVTLIIYGAATVLWELNQ